MKRNMLIFIIGIGLLLTGCSMRVGPDKTEYPIKYIQNEDIDILEFNLDFSKLENRDAKVEVLVDHYVEGKYIDSLASFEVDLIDDSKNSYNLSWVHTSVDGVDKLALLVDGTVQEFEFQIKDDYEMAGFNSNLAKVEELELNVNYYLATLLMNKDTFEIPNLSTDDSLEVLKDFSESYVLRLRVADNSN